MLPVPYHGCTCHLRYAAAREKAVVASSNKKQDLRSSTNKYNDDVTTVNEDEDVDGDVKGDEVRPQPWYFHVIASFILVVHGFTFLVPQDSDSEDTDMFRTIGKWFGFDWEWMKPFTPYAQGLASVFNISLGIVSWWTSKESESYNRLIQLRVFAFCVNILHAYVTGPIIYQNDDTPLLTPGTFTGRIIGLFRLSYLTPGLMAAGVTEVILEKEQEQTGKGKKKELEKSTTAAVTTTANNNSSNSKKDKKEK